MTTAVDHASGVPYGGLPDSAGKEQLSNAYVHAVATAARCSLSRCDVDYEGVDLVVKSMQASHPVAFPEVGLQLKCTSQERLIGTDHITWSLNRPNYDQLRADPVLVPRLLVVMVCPPDAVDWVSQDHDRLSISHAAYYVNLRGRAALPNGQDSKTVKVPRSQPFNVERLLGIMSLVGAGRSDL